MWKVAPSYAALSWQRTSPQLCCCYDRYSTVRLWTAESPSIFYRPGSIWLPCVLILKVSLRGPKFESDYKDVIHAIDDRFEQLDEQFFTYGIKALARRSEKVVTLGGDYVEKLQSNFVSDGPLFLCFFHYLLINPRMFAFWGYFLCILPSLPTLLLSYPHVLLPSTPPFPSIRRWTRNLSIADRALSASQKTHECNTFSEHTISMPSSTCQDSLEIQCSRPVCSSFLSLSHSNALHFKNEWSDFNANWHKWTDPMAKALGSGQIWEGGRQEIRDQGHRRPKLDLEANR